MADPPAPDVDEAEQTSAADEEGKSPDGDESEPSAEEPHGRQYSEAYVKQLRKENADNRNRISELEEQVQEIADRDKSEAEKLSDRLAAEMKAREEAEHKLIRFDVAQAYGLDMEAAELLYGSTREEFELRAEKLQKLLRERPKPTTAGFDGGARRTAQQKRSPEEEHNDFLLKALGRTRAT